MENTLLFRGCPAFFTRVQPVWLKSYRDNKKTAFGFDIPVGDDAFCNLTDEDEEQDEGEEPAQVVSRKVKPGAVMDVNL